VFNWLIRDWWNDTYALDEFHDEFDNSADEYNDNDVIDMDDINIDEYLSDDEIPDYRLHANNYSRCEVRGCRYIHRQSCRTHRETHRGHLLRAPILRRGFLPTLVLRAVQRQEWGVARVSSAVFAEVRVSVRV